MTKAERKFNQDDERMQVKASAVYTVLLVLAIAMLAGMIVIQGV